MSIIIFSKDHCPYCSMAENLLLKNGLSYEKFDVGESQDAKERMLGFNPGARTVPQIIINGICVGGYTDLAKLDLSAYGGKINS